MLAATPFLRFPGAPVDGPVWDPSGTPPGPRRLPVSLAHPLRTWDVSAAAGRAALASFIEIGATSLKKQFNRPSQLGDRGALLSRWITFGGDDMPPGYLYGTTSVR